MSPSDLVLGVDGGGTKTVAWLAPLDDKSNTMVLGRGHAGPGNPRAAGFDIAQGNIALAIQSAFDDAQLPRATVAAACFGLAGAGREPEQKRIARWAKEFGITSRAQVTGDAEPILAAASPDNCGIALICGTGSLAWGRNQQGETARCGGWGYLLGDEGSGYAIALAGLRRAVQSLDFRGQPSPLFWRFQQELGAATAEEFIECIYGPKMSRQRLADLAKVVFDVAKDDTEATHIIRVAAGELAKMVYMLADRLFRDDGYILAMTGSLILQQEILRMTMLEHVNFVHPPREVVAVPDPVRGAVQLARRLAFPTN
jgi:N-acetylglucosamine kinase-like BadF-type ATPase